MNYENEISPKVIEQIKEIGKYEDFKNKVRLAKLCKSLKADGLDDTEEFKKIISYYFGVPLENITAKDGEYTVKYQDIEIVMGLRNVYLRLVFPEYVKNLLEQKKEYEYSEEYQKCKEYLELCKNKGTLSEKLLILHPEKSAILRYIWYLQNKGSLEDIEKFKNKIKEEEQSYIEYEETWKKETADALNLILEFYFDCYERNISDFEEQEERDIIYNISFIEILEKLKGLGEI